MKTQYINKLSAGVAVGVLTLAAGFSGSAVADEAPFCGAMDVVFVVDDTGSMGGAIANVQAGIASIAADVVAASGGDYQMGLVTFKNNVQSDVDLAPGNEAAIQTGIAALVAAAGGAVPEASDAALDAVINGTSAASDGGPCNEAFNSVGLRAGAVKIAVLLTDNLPGGCNDSFTATDVDNADRVANDASAKNILISAMYNDDSPNLNTADIMANYAATTGGVYVNTPADGTGTALAIEEIIAACGSSANTCPLSQGYWKNHLTDWPASAMTGLTIGGIYYSVEQLRDILNTPPKKGNSYLILGHQHIATLLNIANGTDPALIADSLAESEAALTGRNLLTAYRKSPRSNRLAEMLEDYNSRELTPDCEELESN